MAYRHRAQIVWHLLGMMALLVYATAISYFVRPGNWAQRAEINLLRHNRLQMRRHERHARRAGTMTPTMWAISRNLERLPKVRK